jgi:glycosyltransferase involved in cell wall biosynthesis
MTDLSIIIPTYQRCDSLRQVLLACGRQTLLPERYEVIVAIDGSTDETANMLRQFDVPYRLRWTIGPNEGPGAARNRGAALAQGDVILFLDDDIILTSSALAEHLAGHRVGDDTVCLGQVQLWPERPLSHWEQYLNQRYDEHYEKMNRPSYQPDFWDCLSGNVSFPRSLWIRSRGFAANFAAAKHDDVELGYRLAQMGVRFAYRPQALGYHLFVKSLEAGLHDAVTNGASAVRLAHFHPELVPAPVVTVWRHYSGVTRYFLYTILVRPGRQLQLTAWSRHWLYRLAAGSLPFAAKRPFFQLAYHLHFWQGVRSEAGPDEWHHYLAQGPK